LSLCAYSLCGHLQFWLCPCIITLHVRIRIVLVTVYSFHQAPLTSTDTAILSGNLSTQNGNGGGSINLALRRVTSAKGWGEVRMYVWMLCIIPNLFQAAWSSFLDFIFSWELQLFFTSVCFHFRR